MERTYWARTDSNNANNPALNLTGDAATQITFVEVGGSGDLLLDYNGGAADPDTQVQIGGQTYDFVFELTASLPTTKSNGSQQVPTQFQGDVIHIVTVQDYPVPGHTMRLAFMPDETVTQAEMDSFGNGAIDLLALDTTTSGAVCFASGTLIATPHGPVPVESLRAGDMVRTVDRAAQPILWISTSAHRWPGSAERHRPTVIPAGALSPDLPSRELVISPRHKLLAAMPGGDEVLVVAQGLVGWRGIRRMKGKRAVTYHHILLARHELLISDGIPSESFYPGRTALDMLNARQRDRLFRLRPLLAIAPEVSFGDRVRPALSVRQTTNLARFLTWGAAVATRAEAA